MAPSPLVDMLLELVEPTTNKTAPAAV